MEKSFPSPAQKKQDYDEGTFFPSDSIFSRSLGSAPPSSLLLPTQTPRTTIQMAPSTHPSSVPIGSTWSNVNNLNINIDNLSLGGRSKTTGHAPSMNQMAGTPTSPLRTPAPGFPAVRPVYSPQTPTAQTALFPTFK
ncbi:hypothetical protein J6590_088582 [Homalodisca vitripennis]|nr:hypothetical protein J6590_088582 [Homalodisca vitripennis]